ncbi:MAG: hypothetical protein ABH971_00445 [bacterium]
MEKEPKTKKLQAIFNVDNLISGDGPKAYKKYHKFFELEDGLNKIIRVESSNELKHKHKDKFELAELVKIARKLFQELQKKYEINVPADFFINKDKNGKDIVYSIVDKIKGEHLGEVKNSEEISKKIEKLYTSVAKYFLDKSLKEGELYLWDICGQSQYVYGKKLDDKEDKIYLIDTDIWLNNSKVGMYLVVYWLTRHISAQENKIGIQFNEARNNIKQFIDQPLPKNISETDMENVNGIKSFLNNEKSDYNPKSAIPAFE